jgi:hypothetical protein
MADEARNVRTGPKGTLSRRSFVNRALRHRTDLIPHEQCISECSLVNNHQKSSEMLDPLLYHTAEPSIIDQFIQDRITIPCQQRLSYRSGMFLAAVSPSQIDRLLLDQIREQKENLHQGYSSGSSSDTATTTRKQGFWRSRSSRARAGASRGASGGSSQQGRSPLQAKRS